MRVYVREEYCCDEWVSGKLKANRKALMKKYGLTSLTFSYTLTHAEVPNFSVKNETDVGQRLIADLDRLTRCL